MKMYERLIPEWQHIKNEFCKENGIEPNELTSKSTTQRLTKIRDRFYAYCEVRGMRPKEMAKATGRTYGAVNKRMRRAGFWELVRQYEKSN